MDGYQMSYNANVAVNLPFWNEHPAYDLYCAKSDEIIFLFSIDKKNACFEAFDGHDILRVIVGLQMVSTSAVINVYFTLITTLKQYNALFSPGSTTSSNESIRDVHSMLVNITEFQDDSNNDSEAEFNVESTKQEMTSFMIIGLWLSYL